MKLRLLPFLCFFLFGGAGLPAQTVVLTEDFSDGIPDSWTVQPVEAGNPDSLANALWLWADNEGLPGDEFWIEFYHMASPTKDNGFAIFAGAYLNNGGILTDHPDTVGTGPAPQPHISDLITPIIDCSGL
ncbi:MAG: hypothetical protein KDC54_16195, partial [Lewinella sp.]|nr:hypothetical protein [Lewinella sp.]